MQLPVPLRRPLKIAAAGALVLLALILAYFVAALVGALVPANADWREPREGIRIFVRTNGVHTWIMVPTVHAEIDWRPLVPAAHIADSRYAGDYLAFGYGNRDFYLNTPTWWDLRPRTALAAAFGRGPALVHAEYEHRPRPDEYQRPVTITREQYRRLAAFIRASFRTDAEGRSLPLLGRGYGPSDIFYEAAGRYDVFRTCNEWTGEGLRSAGIRTGIWTPLERSVMWRFE
ncbi:MAG TPA: TIGR02117 family protein [Allosphingosinicella sp.]|nr:TIGR02117 family protein [Allosphingosinicella sp.]